MVGSVFLGQSVISGFLASILCDKLDCRRGCMIGGLLAATGLVGSFFASNCTHLIISFGVFTGVGLAFCYQAVHISVSHYFNAKRSFAIAIMQMGSSMGQLVWGPLTHYFIDIYTWRGAFLMLSAFSLHLIAIGALLRPHKNEYLHKKQRGGSAFDIAIFKNIPFDLLMFNTTLVSLVLGMFFFHFPAYAVYSGTSIHASALLLGAIGITSLALKPLFGAVMNHPDVDMWTVYSMSQTVSGVVTVLCPLFMVNFTGQLIYAVIFAVYTTPFFTAHAAITLQSVESKHFGASIGILQSVVGLGFFFGPIVGGWTYSVTGSYAFAVQFAGGCLLVNTLVMFAMKAASRGKHGEDILEDNKFNDVTSCHNSDIHTTSRCRGDVHRLKAASHLDIPVKSAHAYIYNTTT
ncbi:monocarboxylate transporter 12-like isoform X2 [Lingula anatina]|nr:monocarboxylate transporter 12-like isoform X2 [Lingula anatina]|eukprot:XP_013395735.1 monocarboxylate transporter 12-like isoform X2 [Lingula anatina]